MAPGPATASDSELALFALLYRCPLDFRTYTCRLSGALDVGGVLILKLFGYLSWKYGLLRSNRYHSEVATLDVVHSAPAGIGRASPDLHSLPTSVVGEAIRDRRDRNALGKVQRKRTRAGTNSGHMIRPRAPVFNSIPNSVSAKMSVDGSRLTYVFLLRVVISVLTTEHADIDRTPTQNLRLRRTTLTSQRTKPPEAISRCSYPECMTEATCNCTGMHTRVQRHIHLQAVSANTITTDS